MRDRKRGRRIHRLSPAEDVERELKSHLAQREAELVAAGWDASAARAEAARLFGDYEAIRGACRDAAERHARHTRRSRMWSELLQDVRYGLRGLMRERSFALLAVVTLALGIGANSAAFGIVNGVLLAPLPYPESSRLVAIWEVNEARNEVAVAWPNFRDLQASTRTLSGMAAYREAFPHTVLGTREPVRAQIALVSATFFDVLRARPMLGRTFREDALLEGGAVAIVVSEAFWRRELGAAADLSAVALNVNGAPAHVIGVMPAHVQLPVNTEIWFPLDVEEASGLGTRSSHNFAVVGRLADGATIAQARQELSAIAQQIRQQHDDNDAIAVAVRGLLEDSTAGARRALLILLGASAFVLLVACTNLASALLARAARRTHELAIRASLGARRVRLMRQLLTESLLLAGFGAVAGLALAHVLIQTLVAFGPDAVPRLEEVRIDGWVIAFTTLLAVGTALTFGIAPALRATTAQPYDALRTGGRGTQTAAQRGAWSLLVGVEVALALLLLIGSGLLIRSFYRVTTVDPGFETENVIAVDVSLPASKYESPAARARYYDEVLERVRQLSSVRNAAVTMSLPLGGFDPFGRFDIEGGEMYEGIAAYRVASSGFFETMRIPLVHGRAFTAGDRDGAQPVIIIDEALADQHFPGRDPLGERISTGGMDGQGEIYATIVGVVKSIRYRTLEGAPEPAYYLPHAQRPDRLMFATLLVRTDQRAGAILPALRSTIREVDGDVGLELATLDERVGQTLAGRRLNLLVLGVFAAIALVLAAIGIYGVVSFAVAQRTREIGIRVALGAAAMRVLWSVGRHTMIAVACGIAAGMLAAVVLARFAASLLYEIRPIDPLTYVSVAGILVGTAVLALVVPAARALRVTPMTALRSE